MQTQAQLKAAKAKAAKAAKAEAAANVAAAIAASGHVAVAPLASNVAPAIIPATVTEAPATPEAVAAANPRAIASALYRAFSDSASIPVKPVAGFKAYRAALGVLRCGNVTPRNAAAIVIALAASGKRFPAAGAEAVTFGRRFKIGATDYCIENGAATDAVSAGAASYDSATEAFTCTHAQAVKIFAVLAEATVNGFNPDAVAEAVAATQAA